MYHQKNFMYLIFTLIVAFAGVRGDAEKECGYRAHSGGDNEKFDQWDRGWNQWRAMPCAPGTKYNNKVCDIEGTMEDKRAFACINEADFSSNVRGGEGGPPPPPGSGPSYGGPALDASGCGYRTHSGGDDDKFEQWDPARGEWRVMPCAPGTYYNASICADPSLSVQDRLAFACTGSPSSSGGLPPPPPPAAFCHYQASSSGNKFFEQWDEGRQEWREIQCANGTVFNSNACNDNATCIIEQLATVTATAPTDCLFRADTGGNSSLFEQWDDARGEYRTMECAYGTIFNPYVCDEQSNDTQACDTPLGIALRTTAAPPPPPIVEVTPPEVVATPPPAPDEEEDAALCGEGWKRHPDLPKLCYKLVEPIPMTYNQSRVICQNDGGRLPRTKTIRRYRQSGPKVDEVWMWIEGSMSDFEFGDESANPNTRDWMIKMLEFYDLKTIMDNCFSFDLTDAGRDRSQRWVRKDCTFKGMPNMTDSTASVLCEKDDPEAQD